MPDSVDHPSHYQSGEIEKDGTSKYEAIKVIQAWDLCFCLGNVIKYVARAGKKTSNPIEDLEKAKWYLERHIQKMKENNDSSGSRNKT